MFVLDSCEGCAYEDSSDIMIHLQFCMHCKRAYAFPEDRDAHKDLYEMKGESNEEIY